MPPVMVRLRMRLAIGSPRKGGDLTGQSCVWGMAGEETKDLGGLQAPRREIGNADVTMSEKSYSFADS
jgi:hypothetical protein